MTYLNISANLDHEPMVLSASDAQLRVWLSLMCYSHRQDSDGRIVGFRTWTPAMWQRAIGTTIEFIEEKSPLWHVEHEVLIIHLFDHKSQANYLKKKQDGAKYVSRRKDRHPYNTRKTNGSQVPQHEAPLGDLLGDHVGDHVGDSLRK